MKVKQVKGSLKHKFPLLLFLAFIILFFVSNFEVYRVSSQSMENTFFTGDYVLVRKYWIQHILGIKKIKKDPHNKIFIIRDSTPDQKFIIKRCIGAPGDILKFNNDHFFINGSTLPEYPTTKRLFSVSVSQIGPLLLFLDSCNVENVKTDRDKLLINTTKSIIQILYNKNLINDYEISSKKFLLFSNSLYNSNGLRIPKVGTILDDSQLNDFKISFNKEEIQSNNAQNNYYFMIGDNRYYSHDSRSFGLIPYTRIVGRVILILRSRYSNSNGIIFKKKNRYFKKL